MGASSNERCKGSWGPSLERCKGRAERGGGAGEVGPGRLGAAERSQFIQGHKICLIITRQPDWSRCEVGLGGRVVKWVSNQPALLRCLELADLSALETISRSLQGLEKVVLLQRPASSNDLSPLFGALLHITINQ